jgi:hypothetical protein
LLLRASMKPCSRSSARLSLDAKVRQAVVK